MKTTSWLIIGGVLIAVTPLLYLFFIYDQLPATIATHYGLNGPDKFGSKAEIWFISGLMAGVSLFAFLLIWNLNNIDPKKTAKLSQPVFRKFALIIVFFIASLNLLIIQNTLHYNKGIERYLPAIMGIFFAVLGNFMHSVKPNYFVGVRTPWTLDNEYVWKQTHQLAGKLWFAGGLFIALCGLILANKAALFVMVGGVFILAIIPVIYSYTQYRKLMKKIN